LNKPNIITVAIVSVFILPILYGAFKKYSHERVQSAIASLFNFFEFLLALLTSIYITRRIFFGNKTGVFKNIYDLIPEDYKRALLGKEGLVYLIVVPILLMILILFIRLITIPVYNNLLLPLSKKIYTKVNSMGKSKRHIIGALWQLPRSISFVLVLVFLLNFYVYFFSDSFLTKYMHESSTYQFLYKNALYPVLNSNIAKQLPVIIKNSLKNRSGIFGDDNIRVIEYFNGVTLSEAVKSRWDIDNKAKEIVGSESDSTKKGYLLYKWISNNVKYDYEKAEKVSENSENITSGAINAFETRKGICFDYSSLFVAMCRSVGLKVRLVTGLAYSGVSWGDHAWNQVYSEEKNRWINVDTTFGSIDNYYDRADFNMDHKNADIQKQWQ